MFTCHSASAGSVRLRLPGPLPINVVFHHKRSGLPRIFKDSKNRVGGTLLDSSSSPNLQFCRAGMCVKRAITLPYLPPPLPPFAPAAVVPVPCAPAALLHMLLYSWLVLDGRQLDALPRISRDLWGRFTPVAEMPSGLRHDSPSTIQLEFDAKTTVCTLSSYSPCCLYGYRLFFVL